MRLRGSLLLSLIPVLACLALAGCSGQVRDGQVPHGQVPHGRAPEGRAPASSTDRRPADVPVHASAHAGPVGPLAVLHDWDARRSAAWAAGDVAALRGLYVPGSRAGTRDVGLLGRYVERGITVPGLRMQVFRVQVLVQRPRLLVLRVTERLATTRVRVGAEQVRLPRDGVQTRVVELRRGVGEWRVAEVRRDRR